MAQQQASISAFVVEPDEPRQKAKPGRKASKSIQIGLVQQQPRDILEIIREELAQGRIPNLTLEVPDMATGRRVTKLLEDHAQQYLVRRDLEVVPPCYGCGGTASVVSVGIAPRSKIKAEQFRCKDPDCTYRDKFRINHGKPQRVPPAVLAMVARDRAQGDSYHRIAQTILSHYGCDSQVRTIKGWEAEAKGMLEACEADLLPGRCVVGVVDESYIDVRVNTKRPTRFVLTTVVELTTGYILSCCISRKRNCAAVKKALETAIDRTGGSLQVISSDAGDAIGAAVKELRRDGRRLFHVFGKAASSGLSGKGTGFNVAIERCHSRYKQIWRLLDIGNRRRWSLAGLQEHCDLCRLATNFLLLYSSKPGENKHARTSAVHLGLQAPGSHQERLESVLQHGRILLMKYMQRGHPRPIHQSKQWQEEPLTAYG